MSSTDLPGAFDETYDVYDPATTFTTDSRQRQQQAALRPALRPASTVFASPDPLSRRSSSVSESSRTLRRSPRSSDIYQQQLQQQLQQQRLSHRRALSVDASGHHQYIEQSIPVSVHPAPLAPTSRNAPAPSPAPQRPAFSEAHSEDDRFAVDDTYERLNDSDWPRRSTNVSPTTASAVLWTLEEAFRRPFPFTTDWDEVNAPMSDLVGVAPAATALGGAAAASHGRVQNGAPRPVPVNTNPPSGVRTPTDIMRQRREREGRRKAEQEARDREQQQQQESQPQPPVQQQPYAAGVDRMSQHRATTSAGAGHRRTGSQPGPPPSSAQPVPGQPKPQQPGVTKPADAPQEPRRVAFPHAFERWETLSSHWEGLTGYWIRKLEQNNEALERDPLSQQMARQVTDLSAAGANLFHAVVELQRLRASSERKFQRWFFDTRAEQERARELQAELERQIQTERQARAEAVASFQKAESDKKRVDDLVKEMRRELQISKDEARRAWEELGRREQEERDRTASLRNGEPTLVGGVQVVPMIPSRQHPINYSSTEENEDRYARDAAMKMSDAGDAQYYDDQPASPTGSDPFSETVRKTDPASTTPSSQPQPSYPGHFYRPENATVPGHTRATSDPEYGQSVGGSEPGDDEYIHYQHDSQGRPIVYPGTMSEESDDYDPEDNGPYITEGSYVPSTSASPSVPTTSAPVYNYPPTSGGWGWDSVTPRHRHPTRLSDVMEEDEPRTTPSRASRTSH